MSNFLQEAKDTGLAFIYVHLNKNSIRETLLLPPNLIQVTKQTHLSTPRQDTSIQRQPYVQFPDSQAGHTVQLLSVP